MSATWNENTFSTKSESAASESVPVPNVLIVTASGSMPPITQARATSHRFARPAATIFFATDLAI